MTDHKAIANADLGSGKSRVALMSAIKFVQGKLPSKFEPLVSRRVAFVVNDLRLADELAERANSMAPGIAVVRRGLEATPPDQDSGTMCPRYGDMQLWLWSGGSAEGLCAHCRRNAWSNDPCAYHKQDFRNHPIIILAGATVTAEAPYGSLKRKHKQGRRSVEMPAFDAVIIDEPRFTAFVGGMGPKPVMLKPDMLNAKALRPKKDLKTSARSLRDHDWGVIDDKLDRLSALVADGLAALSPGQSRSLTFGELRAVDRDPDEWRSMRKLIFRLKAELPKQAGKEEGDAFKAAIETPGQWNRVILRLARACEAIAQALEIVDADGNQPADEVEMPRLALVRSKRGGRSGLCMRWREVIDDEWRAMPTLMLDATADLDLVRKFHPGVKIIADARITVPPCVKVLQVFDKLAGYASWAPKPEAEDDSDGDRARRKTALNNMRRLANTLDVASVIAGPVGVIVPMRLEEELARYWKARGHKPPGIIVGHYNGVRGSNRFEHVRTLFIVSRPSPSPPEIENIAETITPRLVRRLGNDGDGKQVWFERGTGIYLMRDGTARAALLSERHPDPSAEQIRRQIVDAELDQAAGRGRAIRRTEGNPLIIIRLTGQPSSRDEVDQLVKLDDVLCFDEIDALAARGVLVEVSIANKGSREFLATVVGVEVEALKKRLAARAVHWGKSPYKNYLYMEIFPSEKPSSEAFQSLETILLKGGTWTAFRVKLNPDARYWTTVRVRDVATADAASAVLKREGAEPALIEAVRPPVAPATEPAATRAKETAREAPSAPAGTTP